SATVFAIAVALRRRRRFAEAFESVVDPKPAASRLRTALWEVCRGQLTSKRPSSDDEIGARYVTVLTENVGQPGFRELVLRAADLDTGDVLPFVLLKEPHLSAFVNARGREARAEDGQPAVVD